MHIRDSNVDSKWISMFDWTLLLIKIKTFNLRTPICTVAYRKCLCTRTVIFLNTIINEWTKYFCNFREGFYWGGIQSKEYISVLVEKPRPNPWYRKTPLHWDNIFLTIIDNGVVDWNRLFHEWEHLYSEICHWNLKS